jgi:hypothetical protein
LCLPLSGRARTARSDTIARETSARTESCVSVIPTDASRLPQEIDRKQAEEDQNPRTALHPQPTAITLVGPRLAVATTWPYRWRRNRSARSALRLGFNPGFLLVRRSRRLGVRRHGEPTPLSRWRGRDDRSLVERRQFEPPAVTRCRVCPPAGMARRVGGSLQFLSHRSVSRAEHAQRAASSQYLAHGRTLDVPTRILDVWSQGPAIRGRKGQDHVDSGRTVACAG